MLLALANWIAPGVRAFNVFGYITLRAVLATMTALIISFVVGPGMIRKLTEYKIGQSIRDDGPHQLTCNGVPNSNGVVIARGGDVFPAGLKHHAVYFSGVACRAETLFTRLYVPDYEIIRKAP